MNSQLEYILQNMGDAFVHLDEKWRYVFVNNKALALTGKQKEDLIGKIIWDVFPDMKNTIIEKEYRKLMRTGGRTEFEVHYPPYNIWLEVRAFSNEKGLSVFYTDITAQKNTREKNKIYEQEISKAIINAQEQERFLIGSELHDNINQILAGTLLSLGMTRNAGKHQAVIRIEESMKYINMAIEEIRKLSHRLAPASFDNTSFADSVKELVNSFNVNNRFKISLLLDETVNKGISNNIQLNLYRILQEQLNNILKHSQADLIEISIHNKINAVKMRICDNGIGFDALTVKAGIGLNNIRKRVETFAGTFGIHSSANCGCEMLIEIPAV